MQMRTLSSLVVVALAGSAFAAPSLEITKPPVVGPATGPAIDPNAVKGQWFQLPLGTAAGPVQIVRSHEFYDNIPGFGGGAAGSGAVRGSIIQIDTFTDPFGVTYVTGYKVRASITNDTGTEEGQWNPGSNLHDEARTFTSPYRGTLYNAALTIHWADDGVAGNFAPGGPNIGPESNTYAVNHDELAWYSYTTSGQYQVPAWGFGDIAPGQTVSRDLEFRFYNPVLGASIGPGGTQGDLLIARTNDLKIGKYFQTDPWVRGIRDDGSPYPIGGFTGTAAQETDLWANSSVFHDIVPAPGAGALLGLGLIAAGRRRR
jgi:hypothetical protein